MFEPFLAVVVPSWEPLRLTCADIGGLLGLQCRRKPISHVHMCSPFRLEEMTEADEFVTSLKASCVSFNKLFGNDEVTDGVDAEQLADLEKDIFYSLKP